MNVRTKLLVSQTLNAMLVIGVAAIAVMIAQRFDYQLRRVELAYDQRQTITMLAVQTFHYKTALERFVNEGGGARRELEQSRDDAGKTLKELSSQTEQELSFVHRADRTRELEEVERVGRLAAALAEVDRLAARIMDLNQNGPTEEARQLYRLVEQRFSGEISELLADAMADEQGEVVEVDADIADIAAARVAFLYVTGFCGLAISLVTGFALYRSLSGPMKRLLAGVRAVRAGNLTYRVETAGTDEFAELARQFNEMAQNLEDRERQLLGMQSELEQQVRQRTSELETANRRLSYLDRRRLQFLADVSHELRTPITILRGEAEVTLRMQPGSQDAYREALTRIAQQSKQMGRLIDDLLFLVRSESDTVAFDRQRLDLREIVADAVRDGSLLARGKGISVTDRLPEQPVWVEADAQRLRQAALIGIDNAINYSAAGLSVEVSLEAVDGRAVISVLDHGVGVPAEELPYVFERFYRVRGGADRRTDGSGLGLSIAKWIAEKHGGSIAMASTPGEHTELTIELPLQGRSAA
jgi:two-component system, OmpR family, sensor kinase